MSVKIEGVKIKQSDLEFIVGKAKTEDLLRHMEVDEWSQANPDAYQREVGKARAREFGRFIASGGASPSSILVNIRDGDMDVIEQVSDHEYEIADDVTLWVVDGQHRLRGLELLGEQSPQLLELELPVIVMALGGESQDARYKEALQFLIINRTQKGVRSDLADRILVQVAEMEGSERVARGLTPVLPSSLAKDMDWRPRAVKLSDLLNKRQDSPLRGRIKLPNLRAKGTTVSQVAVVRSLKGILNTESVLGLQTDDDLTSVLVNLWQAVRDLCPAPFEEVDDTGKAAAYVLLKTTGVSALHKVLAGLVPFCPREEGVRVLSSDAITDVLSHAGDLLEATFWQSSGDGTAGAMGTGEKTFSTIARLILDRIRDATEPEKGVGKVIC